jgi:hypothetical protein
VVEGAKEGQIDAYSGVICVGKTGTAKQDDSGERYHARNLSRIET